MSDYLQIAIADTYQAIARNEALMRLHPSPSVAATLESIRRRLRKLEAKPHR